MQRRKWLKKGHIKLLKNPLIWVESCFFFKKKNADIKQLDHISVKIHIFKSISIYTHYLTKRALTQNFRKMLQINKNKVRTSVVQTEKVGQGSPKHLS